MKAVHFFRAFSSVQLGSFAECTQPKTGVKPLPLQRIRLYALASNAKAHRNLWNQIPLFSSCVPSTWFDFAHHRSLGTSMHDAYYVNAKRNTNYGILLSVSLLGWSKSNALSMSDISSDWLTRRTRWCLLLPSAVVSPSCSEEPQPKGRKTKTQKITAKITLRIESLFTILPFLKPNKRAGVIRLAEGGFFIGRLAQKPIIIYYSTYQPFCQWQTLVMTHFCKVTFEIGFVWVCFFRTWRRFHFHNPLFWRSLRSFEYPANWLCFA